MGELNHVHVHLQCISPGQAGELAVHIAKFYLYIRGYIPEPYEQCIEQWRKGNQACCVMVASSSLKRFTAVHDPSLDAAGYRDCIRGSWDEPEEEQVTTGRRLGGAEDTLVDHKLGVRFSRLAHGHTTYIFWIYNIHAWPKLEQTPGGDRNCLSQTGFHRRQWYCAERRRRAYSGRSLHSSYQAADASGIKNACAFCVQGEAVHGCEHAVSVVHDTLGHGGRASLLVETVPCKYCPCHSKVSSDFATGFSTRLAHAACGPLWHSRGGGAGA
jgi:hypothetical protein